MVIAGDDGAAIRSPADPPHMNVRSESEADYFV